MEEDLSLAAGGELSESAAVSPEDAGAQLETSKEEQKEAIKPKVNFIMQLKNALDEKNKQKGE